MIYQLEHAAELLLTGYREMGGKLRVFGTELDNWPQTLMISPRFHQYDFVSISHVWVPYLRNQFTLCYSEVARYVKVEPPNLNPDDGER